MEGTHHSGRSAARLTLTQAPITILCTKLAVSASFFARPPSQNAAVKPGEPRNRLYEGEILPVVYTRAKNPEPLFFQKRLNFHARQPNLWKTTSPYPKRKRLRRGSSKTRGLTR